MRAVGAGASSAGVYAPQHFLNFLPEPQGHGSLRPVRGMATSGGTDGGLCAGGSAATRRGAVCFAGTNRGSSLATLRMSRRRWRTTFLALR